MEPSPRPPCHARQRAGLRSTTQAATTCSPEARIWDRHGDISSPSPRLDSTLIASRWPGAIGGQPGSLPWGVKRRSLQAKVPAEERAHRA
eukprot:9464586-Pyramimonas_sp.AAC.1